MRLPVMWAIVAAARGSAISSSGVVTLVVRQPVEPMPVAVGPGVVAVEPCDAELLRTNSPRRIRAGVRLGEKVLGDLDDQESSGAQREA